MKLLFCSSLALLLQVFGPHVRRNCTKGALTQLVTRLRLGFMVKLLHTITKAVRGNISISVRTGICSTGLLLVTAATTHFATSTSQICPRTMYCFLEPYLSFIPKSRSQRRHRGVCHRHGLRRHMRMKSGREQKCQWERSRTLTCFAMLVYKS